MAKKRVTAMLDEDLWRQVRTKALNDGLTASDLVEVALMQFVQWKAPQKNTALSNAPVEVVDVGQDLTPRQAMEVKQGLVDPSFAQFRPVPKTRTKR